MRDCIGESVKNLWRLTGLNFTRTLYTTARNYVNKLINRKKTVFYKKRLQNADNKHMFTIVNSLISQKKGEYTILLFYTRGLFKVFRTFH